MQYILGSNCYHDATREAWTLLRATQIDSPAIQKRADISAHERVKPEVAGSHYFRLRTWRVKEENVRRNVVRALSRLKRRSYEIHLIFAVAKHSR